MKNLFFTLLAVLFVGTSYGQLTPIMGPSSVCVGSSIVLTNATPGGTWSSPPPAIATYSMGLITGVSVGTFTITYSLGGSYVTHSVVVNALPPPITGDSTVCVGSNLSLAESIPGGIWSVAPITVLTLSTGSIFVGTSPGIATVSYTLGAGCTVSKSITVNATPAAITGPSTICEGTSVTMSTSPGGGYWTSDNVAVAIVGSSSGIVTAVAPGTAFISYTMPTGCSASLHITVNPAPPPITGPSSVCEGNVMFVSDAGAGSWSCSPTTIMSIYSLTGVCTGISAGVATVTFTNSSSCIATMPVTVNATPAPITGTTSLCVGPSVTLSSATGGGTWTSAIPVIVAVGSSSGIVTGLTTGAPLISYTLATGCFTTRYVTVNSSPVLQTVTGGGSYCTGGTGLYVGLASSTTGTSYQLFNGTIPVGSTLMGTGTSLSFGLQTAAGTYSVVATTTGGCTATMSGTATITINPLPAVFTVSGGGTFCMGGAGMHVILSGSVIGVNYQLYSGSSPVGSPVAGTGGTIDFGLLPAGGTYTVVAISPVTGCTNNMSGSAVISVSPTPTSYVVTGGGAYCTGGVGVHINLASSDIGVNYQLFNGTTMVGSAVAGTGMSIDFGLVTSAGIYTVVATTPATGCSNNMSGSAIVSISPLPATYTVTGGGSYCAGGTGVAVGLSSSSTGVNYHLMSGGTTLGSPLSGSGSPLSFGLWTPVGIYDVIATDATTGCSSNMIGSAVITTTPVVVTSSTVTATSGSTICAGTSDTFNVATTGGGSSPTYQWYMNSTLVTGATNSNFITMPLSGDVVRANVTSSATCASPAVSADSVTVTVSTPTATATATTAACGGLVTLTGSGGLSYSWSPSTGLACASCAVTTVLPYATIVYTLTTTNTYGCTATATVAVDGNRISGHIGYAGGVSTDTFKVWLIHFNPADSSIIALDSTTSCDDGGAPYYEFMDAATGDYMVKAKLNSSVPGTSGYIPTYSLSSPFWYSGATVSHVSSADSMHIDMVYGTVPAGPGFIAGYVVSGAGKGTAGDAPAEGINIILKNSAGTLITITTTKSDGTYSFNNLAYGTYQLFPENYGDHTTPSAVITLSAGGDSVQNINFKQHTTSHTITPYENNKVKPVVNVNTSISIYPNPASDALFVSCDKNIWGTTLITITDMTGRKVLETTIAKANISGSKVDLTGINKGMYIITAKSEGNTYTGKLTVR